MPAGSSGTPQTFKGVTIIIDFPDMPGIMSKAEIENYLNQTGYNNYAANGSIKDYWFDVSNGKVTYTNTVYGYHRASKPNSYYADGTKSMGGITQELINEALGALKNTVNWDELSTTVKGDGNTYFTAINFFHSGNTGGVWSKGLWPHKWAVYKNGGIWGVSNSNTGKTTYFGTYQITNMGTSLALSTFCHETGHVLFLWPDFYDYGQESSGTGRFDLMASSGPSNDPYPPNGYLRYKEGWENSVIEPSNQISNKVELKANNFEAFKYTNPSNSNEFFYIEARKASGRSRWMPDHGLTIWHVDTSYGTSNNFEDMTAAKHYIVSLEQADGQFHLEKGTNGGDSNDLFDNGNTNGFTDTTTPDTKWWNGSASGLSVLNISPVGDTMHFYTNPDQTPPLAQHHFQRQLLQMETSSLHGIH